MRGEVDERRLGEALEALLAEHRRRGSPAEELIARGAAVIVTRASRGHAAVRLGWLDDWPADTVGGGRMWLGFVALADISAGRACRRPSRGTPYARAGSRP